MSKQGNYFQSVLSCLLKCFPHSYIVCPVGVKVKNRPIRRLFPGRLPLETNILKWNGRLNWNQMWTTFYIISNLYLAIVYICILVSFSKAQDIFSYYFQNETLKNYRKVKTIHSYYLERPLFITVKYRKHLNVHKQ